MSAAESGPLGCPYFSVMDGLTTWCDLDPVTAHHGEKVIDGDMVRDPQRLFPKWMNDCLDEELSRALRLETRALERGLPHPEVIKSDPALCSHAVLDELAGIPWGFEDCLTCGKRFPMRDDDRFDFQSDEP